MKNFRFLNETEKKTHEAEPNIGMGYGSKCLDEWIEYFSDKFKEGQDSIELNRYLVSGLLHTLIAARARNYRMRKEIGELTKEK